MVQPRYLAALAFGAFLWGGLFLAFTWIIDPYGISPIRVSWHGVNQYKPKRRDIDRLIKPYEVWKYQPRTVFLGTSRIQQSIDPSVLDETPYAPAYNASIPANSLAMNVSYLRQYVRLDHQLRTVVVELFLSNFLGQQQEHASETFVEYARNAATLFLSADTLWASMQTLRYNRTISEPCHEITAGGYLYYPPGHNSQLPFDRFPAAIWKLKEGMGSQLDESAFDSLRELISISREYDLKLIFVLTPNHAYDDFYLESTDAWKLVEEWLRRLSAEEAAIYSFSQPNAWVYEPVRTGMRHWYDPYHFSLEMGRAMQLALIGRKDNDTPKDFMVRLTPGMVPGHVESRRQAIRLWTMNNPQFAANVREERRKYAIARAQDIKDGHLR
jgi:hypothetical protein